MSYAKRHAAHTSDAFTIGTDNPLIGHQISVKWLRPWGGKPSGYTVRGILLSAFVVGGRTLIGEIRGYGDDRPANLGPKRYHAPWSRNYLKLEV